jgi:formyl-CoA transferase/CoA:oxalate CoA-transferase
VRRCSATSARTWLASAIGLEAMLDDPRFATNLDRVKHRREIESTVEAAIAGFDRSDLLRRLAAAEMPAAPVNTVDQVLGEPQTRSRPAMRRMTHPKLGDIPVIGMPLSFSAIDPDVRRHAPARGEHIDEVLAECGYSPQEVRACGRGKRSRKSFLGPGFHASLAR